MSLESGRSYPLSQLFAGARRMIIPDLQRDYCWGDPKTSLAPNFLGSLLDLFEEAQGHPAQVSLGLLYAYENPLNFIYIADGQQRLTTLYLLLGVIYRRLGGATLAIKEATAAFLALDPSAKALEPRLRYEVRESTVYFMKHFLNEEVFGPAGERPLDQKRIKSAPWFRKEYETDPSILSMLHSIEAFWKHDGLSQLVPRLSDFTRFLLGLQGNAGIRFVYFDMKKREFGEKMYVIINTCGAPMEMNEHLKPLLVGQLSEPAAAVEWSAVWERWQDFFWINRQKGEISADKGFNQFLQWFVMIRERTEIAIVRKAQGKDEPRDVYSYFAHSGLKAETVLRQLEDFYTQVKSLWFQLGTPEYASIFTQISGKEEALRHPRDLPPEATKWVLLPLLALMVRFPLRPDWHALFLRRLRRNYFQMARETGRGVDWRHLLRMIEKIPESGSWLEDIHRFSDFGVGDEASAVGCNEWFDEEERIKDLLFSERHQLATGKESSLWQWEDHGDFLGDITPLLQMCQLADGEAQTPVLKKEYFESAQRREVISRLEVFYESYCFLEGLMDGTQVAATKDSSLFNLANHYRLFKLLIGCQTIGRLYFCNFAGVRFSPKAFSLKDTRIHFKKCEFLRLCRDGRYKLLEYSRAKIRETLSMLLPLKSEDFSAQKTLPVWFILKVLKAESEGVLLSYYDGGTGIASYGDAEYDQIFPGTESEIKLANLLCGHARKGGGGGESHVEYSPGDDPAKLNSPLIKIEERLFNERLNPELCETDKVVLRQQIEAGDKALHELLHGVELPEPIA
jgi:hypothetical protein